MDTETIERFNEIIAARDQYFHNAQESMAKNEPRKASELLWGAVTQTVKAVALIANRQITTHADFFSFTRTLANDLNDKNLYFDFVSLNDLHRNFYDGFVPADVIPSLFEKSVQYIKRLDMIISEKAS